MGATEARLRVEFTGAYGPIGTGVAFQASLDGATVICIATGAALSLADHSSFAEDLLGQYERNRQLLRDAAEVLILAGRFEPGGFVEIRQEDIRSECTRSAANASKCDAPHTRAGEGDVNMAS